MKLVALILAFFVLCLARGLGIGSVDEVLEPSMDPSNGEKAAASGGGGGADFEEDWQEQNTDQWNVYNPSDITTFVDIGGGDYVLQHGDGSTGGDRFYGLEANTDHGSGAFYIDFNYRGNGNQFSDIWFLSNGTPDFGGNDPVGTDRFYVQFSNANSVRLWRRDAGGTTTISPLTNIGSHNTPRDFRLVVGAEVGNQRTIELWLDPNGTPQRVINETVSTTGLTLGTKWGFYDQGFSSASLVRFGTVTMNNGAAPALQVVTIEWESAAQTSPGDFANTPVIRMRVNTSDGGSTLNEITPSLTFGGSAVNGVDYDVVGPVAIPAGTVDGALVDVAPIDILGANNSGPPECIMTIDADASYDIGPEGTHTHTIQDAVP